MTDGWLIKEHTVASLLCLLIVCACNTKSFSQHTLRQDIPLNNNWRSIADDNSNSTYNGFESTAYNDSKWKPVSVPHSWDDYYGFRRMRHGNSMVMRGTGKILALTTNPQVKDISYFLKA